MSDTDLESALSGEAPTEQPEPVVEEAPQEAESAPEQPEVEAQPEPAEAEEKGHSVPLPLYLELRREVQQLKAQMPKSEPAPPPDVLDDPQGYHNHIKADVSQDIHNIRLDMSEEMARDRHGDAVVDEAFNAFSTNADPTTYQSIMAARSPWMEVVKWHQAQQVQREIGDDPQAYKQRIEAEIRQKVQAEMVAKQAQDAAARLAPSMADVTGTGGGPKSTWAGPTPLSSAIGD